mgnify:FL=1
MVTKFKIGDIVAFNTQPDRCLYKIVSIGQKGFELNVVPVQFPNDATQAIDASLALKP